MLMEACQKSRPWKRFEHLWCLETASPSTAASLEGKERNHKGLSPGNRGSAWPAEHDFLPGSPEWRGHCWHLHCHGGTAGQGCCCMVSVHSKPWRPWAGERWCATQRWLSSAPGAEQRPHDWICWSRLWSSVWKCFSICWISTVGFHLGKARLKMAAWFPGHAGIQKCWYPWLCPRPFLTCFRQILEACEGTTHSPLLRSWSAAGAPSGRNASIHPGDDRESSSSFPKKD